MGTVWRADDVLLGRAVAVKEVELPGGPGRGPPALRERALREARAAARLNHPGVVTLHDVIEADGRVKLADFGIASLQEDTQRTLSAGPGPGARRGRARNGGAGAGAGGRCRGVGGRGA